MPLIVAAVLYGGTFFVYVVMDIDLLNQPTMEEMAKESARIIAEK